MRSHALPNRVFLPVLTLVAVALLPNETLAQEDRTCVDINIASAQELQRITQIGPARAAQIMSLREDRAFRSVDESVRVSGIAAARLQQIKAQGGREQRRELIPFRNPHRRRLVRCVLVTRPVAGGA